MVWDVHHGQGPSSGRDTNKGSHGSYGRNVKSASEGNNVFNLPIGDDCVFCGFYGSSTNTIIEDIGMYVKPIISSMIELGGASAKHHELNCSLV
ncbi:hypothetical protein FXO38_14740 [Capsicum annuum]|nr:hypothetical protein FXO38_14740 [Capsicum annuum]